MKGLSFENVLTDLLRQVGGPERPGYLILRGEPLPIVLVFGPDQDLPVSVFKAAYDRSIVEDEFAKLGRLQQAASQTFSTTIPRPLRMSVREVDPTGTLVSALPGIRLKDLSPERVFGPQTAHATLREVTSWLADYHEVAGKIHRSNEPAGRNELIEQPADTYLKWFRVTDDERALIRESVAGLPDPGSPGLPHCLGHGDFTPANVLWDDGRIGVIDFEFALEPCLALEDLFHFLASMKSTTSARDREGQRRGFFEEVFYGDGHLAVASRQTVQRLAQKIAVDSDLIDKLFVLCWVRLAVQSVQRWAESLGHQRLLLDDPERLWQALDAEPEEFLPVSRIGGGTCANLRQHLEMRARFVLARL